MFKTFIVLVSVLALMGCETMNKPMQVVKGPPVQEITSPYHAAMQCVRQIPETRALSISVLDIKDNTGKVNIAEGGTGSFMTQGATDQFYSSLADVGVPQVEASETFRKTTKYYRALGVKARIGQPKFVITGSITGLDFLPGGVIEASAFGAGVKGRRYNAIGRMDVRLITLAQRTAGVVVATSKVNKQFAAIEYEAGFGRFLGSGKGLTFASFRIGGGKREPMQLAVGYLADYAAVDLVTQLLLKVNKKRTEAVLRCREMLADPDSDKKIRVALAS